MDDGESSRNGKAFSGNEGDWPGTAQASDGGGGDGGGVDQALFYDEVGGFDRYDEMGAGLGLIKVLIVLDPYFWSFQSAHNSMAANSTWTFENDVTILFNGPGKIDDLNWISAFYTEHIGEDSFLCG